MPKGGALTTVLALLCAAPLAYAADTTEAFDQGAVDAELYLAVANPDRVEGQAASDVVLGYGLTGRFSLLVGVTLEQNLQGDARNSDLHLGAFYNLLDTEHWDFDLFLFNHVGGEAFRRWQAEPGFELNLDSDNAMSGVGLYLRGSVALGTHPEKTNTGHRVLFTWEVGTTLGAYWTMASGHQLLVEADAGVVAEPGPERRFNLGGVALGYNVTLSSWLELINQLYLDLPQEGEQLGYVMSTGVIVTL